MKLLIQEKLNTAVCVLIFSWFRSQIHTQGTVAER